MMLHSPRRRLTVITRTLLSALTGAALPAQAAPAKEWTDPATGHRVVRISREAGSSSYYFHQQVFTPEGDRMLISIPSGIGVVDLKTWSVDTLVPGITSGPGGSSGLEAGRKSRRVFYGRRTEQGTVLLATDIDSRATEEIARLPFPAALNGVSADETHLLCTATERRPRPAGDPVPPKRGPQSARFVSVDAATGAFTEFHRSTDWLNHAQCSPTDPTLALFCHEGDWHEVDRVWTIRLGEETAQLMHRRTMPYEIAGHEFFSQDGQWVWYDLQTPRSAEFWLAGVKVSTGERIRYALARSEWSVHYNVSPDGTLFAGDGGGPDSVANRTPLPDKKRLDPPGNGQWIYLFRPEPDFTPATVSGEPARSGRFRAEKLVDMRRHDYGLEPNVRFTPDGKWIVFRGNWEGERHVYAVEVARAEK